MKTNSDHIELPIDQPATRLPLINSENTKINNELVKALDHDNFIVARGVSYYLNKQDETKAFKLN